MTANQDSVKIKDVQWLRVLPILHIWQALRIGFRLRVLLTCLLTSCALLELTQMSATTPLPIWRFPSLESIPLPVRTLVTLAAKLWADGFDNLSTPVTTLVLALLLVIVAGVAVARATATEFCRMSRTGAVSSIRYSARQGFRSLLSLFLAVMICSVPAVLWWAAGRTLSTESSIGFLVQLVFCLLTMATGVVVGIAWLLSLAAIGTDGCDGSDALSRSISYLLSHKLYTFILTAASLLLAEIAYSLTVTVLVFATMSVSSETSHLPSMARTLLSVVPNAAALGVFLASVTISYILLRKAEDAIDLREIDGGKPAEPSIKEATAQAEAAKARDNRDQSS